MKNNKVFISDFVTTKPWQAERFIIFGLKFGEIHMEHSGERLPNLRLIENPMTKMVFLNSPNTAR